MVAGAKQIDAPRANIQGPPFRRTDTDWNGEHIASPNVAILEGPRWRLMAPLGLQGDGTAELLARQLNDSGRRAYGQRRTSAV